MTAQEQDGKKSPKSVSAYSAHSSSSSSQTYNNSSNMEDLTASQVQRNENQKQIEVDQGIKYLQILSAGRPSEPRGSEKIPVKRRAGVTLVSEAERDRKKERKGTISMLLSGKI